MKMSALPVIFPSAILIYSELIFSCFKPSITNLLKKSSPRTDKKNTSFSDSLLEATA